MKKNIFIVVCAVFSLLVTSCNPQETVNDSKNPSGFTCENVKTDLEKRVCEQIDFWKKGKIDDTDFFSFFPALVEVALPNRPDILVYIYEQGDFNKTGLVYYQSNIKKLSRLYGNINHTLYNDKKSYDLYLSYLFQTRTAAIYSIEARNNIKKYSQEDTLYPPQKRALDDFVTFFDMPADELTRRGKQYEQETKEFDYNNISAMHFYFIASRNADKQPSPNKKLHKESLLKAYNIRKKLPDLFLDISIDSLND